MDENISLRPLAVGCIGVIVLIILGISIFSVTVVDPAEVAVVTRFGNVVGVRNSGTHFEPFADVKKYDVRNIALSTKETAATSDLQDVNISITVNYQIKGEDAMNIYTKIGTMEDLEAKIIKPTVSGRLKSVTTKYDAESLLQKRADVTKEVQGILTEELAKNYIDVTSVSLTEIAFANESFNQAIDNKQIAEQNALKAKFDLDRVKIEAEQQRVQSQTLTPQYLQKLYIEKWNGELPQTLVTDDKNSIILPTK